MKEKEFIPKPKEIKETKEKEPEMRLKFFFSPHLKKEDFSSLRDDIKNSDVYVPEIRGHESRILNIFQRISSGQLNPKKFEKQYKQEFRRELPDGLKGMFESLSGLKKPVYFVDLPHEHELNRKFAESKAHEQRALLNFLSGNFTKALISQKKCIETYAQAQKGRENYIEDNLEGLKPKILKDHPHLRNKKEINILVSLGIAHTPIYHLFRKRKKMPSQQKLPFRPYIHLTTEELARRKNLFPEKEIKDEEIAKTFIESILNTTLKENKSIKNSVELVKVSKFLSSKFTETDVENFSKMLGKKHSAILFDIFFSTTKLNSQKLFEPPLKEWGVKLPKTKKEVVEIIKKAEKKK